MNTKITAIVLISLIAMSGIASAGEHTAITYKWDFFNHWNIDYYLWIEKTAPTTFWANQFTILGEDSNVGYLGIQTTTQGDKALFSVWDANAAEPFTGIEGKGCNTFEEEGKGYHCYLPINITQYTYYRLRLWVLDEDDNGQWWGAWIKNGTDNTDSFIGKIRVNKENDRVRQESSWTEYYGYYSDCNKIPKSIASFLPPYFDNGKSQAIYSKTYGESCKNFDINSNFGEGYVRIDKGG